jgi:hypothetical protein
MTKDLVDDQADCLPLCCPLGQVRRNDTAWTPHRCNAEEEVRQLMKHLVGKQVQLKVNDKLYIQFFDR